MNPYSSLCDDFGVYVYLNTKMELPTARETVLHFFDSLQKSYPKMTDFERRDSGEFVLEEDREQGNYRWVTLDGRRVELMTRSGIRELVSPRTPDSHKGDYGHVLLIAGSRDEALTRTLSC